MSTNETRKGKKTEVDSLSCGIPTLLPGKITLKVGWLLDGADGSVRRGALLGIRDGRLHTVETFPGRARPVEGPVLDIPGATLLPGLVDAHVHLFMSGTPDPVQRETQLSADRDRAWAIIDGNMEAHLAHGVTAVRDGGDREAHALKYKLRTPAHGTAPVRIAAAGCAWRAPGRYGKLIGRPPRAGKTLAQSITVVSRAGRDHVKIVNSGLNSLLEFGRRTAPQFTGEELAEAVKAARSLGLKTMVHANGEIPVRRALEAGCDSIEHGFFMGTDNLKRMADRGIVWVPTACTMKAYSEHLPAESVERSVCLRNLESQVEQMVRARELGVRMAVGTDSGSLGVHHGEAVLEEMTLFRQAGFTMGEVVACAGGTAADLLGLEGVLGRLVPGMPATFVVTAGGPERLPESLRNPLCVAVEGRVLRCSV